MNTVICPQCDQANIPGSKFCNNCGHRLPPSDTIICPTCQTPNPASLFYCDNCGSRLVKATLPTEIESEPDLEEEDDPSFVRPSDLFSLPTRKPGDTGKLDPTKVPDWLRTGRREGDPQQPPDEPLPEPPEPEGEPTPRKGATDELPDWLVTDSAVDFFQPPSEITTEAYLEMMDNMPLDVEGQSGITDELDLPDWLTDAVKDTGSLTDSKPGSSQLDESDELPDPFRTATSLPDWLAEIGGVASGAEQDADDEEIPRVEDWGVSQSDFEESPEETPTGAEWGQFDFEKSPDWLLDEPEAGDPVAEPSAEASLEEEGQFDFEESPAWLLDAPEAGSDLLEEPHEPMVLPLDWGDWGTAVAPNVDLPNWVGDLARPNAAEFSSWLLELDDLVEPEFVIDEPEPEVVSMADRLSDWLVDEDTAVDEDDPEQYEEKRAVTGMLTGWLTELDEPDEVDEEDEAVTGMLTGWLTDLDESDESDLDADETADDEPEPGMFTQWLANDDEPDSNQASDDEDEIEPGLLTGWLAETEEGDEDTFTDEAPEDTGMFTSWLSGTDETEAKEHLDEDSAEDAAEETLEPGLFTGWLSGEEEGEEDSLGADDLDTGSFTGWLSGEHASSEEPEPEDEPLEDIEPGMLTHWLTDAEDAGADVSLEADWETGQFTSWLSGDETASEVPEPEDEPLEDIEPGMLTGWLTDAEDAEADASVEGDWETGQFTNWLSGDEVSEESDIEDEPEAGNLADWLLDPDESDEAEWGDEALEPGMFTDWLSSEEETEDAAESETDEEALSEKFATGMLTGWLSDLEESDEEEFVEEKEETKAVTGMLTGWLSELDEDEEAEAEVVDSDLLADWLTESDEGEEESFADSLEPLAAADEELADWMQVAEAEPEAMEALPDWFEDLEQAAPTANAEMEGLTGDLFAEDEADGMGLDWLGTGTDDLFAEEEVAAETADSDSDNDLVSDWSAWEDDDDALVDEDPDWMSELDTLGTGSFVPESQTSEFHRRFADLVDYGEPQLEDEPEPSLDEAGLAAEPWLTDELEADEFEDDLPLSEAEIEEAFPDWLTDLGDAPNKNKEHQSELIQEDLPNWLSNMKPSATDTEGSSLPGLTLDNLADDFGEIPEELSGADLPDWLQGIHTSARQDEADETGIEHSSDIPDWLRGQGEPLPEQDASGKLRSILNELPPPQDPKERLAKAEIPEWLDALKPKDSASGSRQVETGPAPKSGPLAGIKGAVEIAPVIAAEHVAEEMPGHQLAVTAEQQQQAALWQQLAEDDLLLSKTAVKPRRRIAWGRILTSLILLVVMSAAILLGNDLPLVREARGAAPESAVAGEAALLAAADKPVLVAFDYTPALGGELEAQAEAVMAQLLANGSSVIAVSQYAAGTAVAATHNDEPALFIPGEAIGLRQLGNCLAEGCEALYGRSVEADLSQVGLIIVLTGERKSLVNWIEQVGSQTGIPVVAGTTQSLEPVALSYMTSGQLEGVLSHSAAMGRYEDVLSEAAADTADQRIITAQVLTQLLLVVVLLISLVWQISRSNRSRKQ